MSDERPAKRIKVAEANSQPTTNTRSDKSRKRAWNLGSKAKRAQDGKGKPNQSQQVRTFSQPSVIAPGDKGIFVSSDKGREKAALLELHDLVQQHLDEVVELNADGTAKAVVGTVSNDGAEENHADSIEASIAAELAELKDNLDNTAARQSKPIQLITLDIPCVSFLRFPVGSTLDPCDVVHRICLRAADPSVPQHGRYVKRLTPISSLGKALSQGLEKVSNDCLPQVFGADSEENVAALKFSIRPTIRNNDKVDRDTVIHTVAAQIQDLGKGEHKVDLKNPDRAVLVEVYRGWIGMSVVDNTNGQRYARGFELLKRFNVAEIYSARAKQDGGEAATS